MATISTTMKGAVLAGLVSLALSTTARADADAMRCDAAKLRKEAKCADCKASCGRRFGSEGARPDAETLGTCIEICDEKFARALDRLNERTFCSAEAACPLCCEADLLRAAAREMACKARCAADDPGCVPDCHNAYGAQLNKILASPICAGTPARVE